jgi:hypothetical protein
MFQITYTMPGQSTVTERGLTAEGAEKLMNLILRNGGSGCRQRTEDVRSARRNELVARGLARAVRGRYYDAIQRGYAA